MSKKIMYSNNSYLDIKAGTVGNGKVNLATGELHFSSHCLNYVDWQAGHNNVSVEDAVGGAKTINTHCGKGWKLNVSKFLIKRENKGAVTSYTYIDENGNYHEFTEKYYYIRKGTKYYIPQKDVKVGDDGKLSYVLKITTYPKNFFQQICYDENNNLGGINNGLNHRLPDKNQLPQISYEYYEVFIERKSTFGLALETDYTQFKDGNFLETRMQEQIELEDKVNAYTNQLAEYIVIQKTNGKIYTEGFYNLTKTNLSKNNFNALLINSNKEENLLLTKSEAMQYNSLLLQQTDEIKNANQTDQNIHKTIKISDINNKINKNINFIDLNKEIRAKSAPDKEIDVSNINSVDNEKLKIISNYFISGEQAKIVNEQILKLLEQSAKNIEDIQKYFKQYLSLKQQLDNLYLQIPVSFLSDGNTVMGFNKDGYFVAEIDAYDNQTAIIYEGDKIVAVKDSNGNEANFEYNKSGLLCKIVDNDEKITKFEYSSNRLEKILMPNNEIAYFSYENDFLTKVSDKYGNVIELKRAGDNYKVVEIQKTTMISSVSDGSIILDEIDNDDDSENIENKKTIFTISYISPTTTSVTDENSIVKTYIFDYNGNPKTIYEGKYADFTKAVSMEYSDDKQSYSVTEDYNEASLLRLPISNTLNSSETDRQLRYTLSNFNSEKTDFVFSCWAYANTVQNNENQPDRKFELRAVVTYKDGTQDEYRAEFDRQNTDWQYLALPVEIKQPLQAGDKFPAELPATVGGSVNIDLYIDFSNGIGNISTNYISFRPGKWQYSTYDEGGRKLTDEDSESNSITTYKYDDNDRVVKQILTDREGNKYETIFEYNKQGKLVRSTDYSGIVNETVYDEKGREIRSIVYNKDDPTSKFYSENRTDEKGNITAEIDESGLYDSTKYLYEDNTSVVVKDGKGNKTSYGYKDGEQVSISGNTCGEELTNTLHYTAGYLTKATNGDTDYGYKYDRWGNTTEINISGNNYVTVEYGNNRYTVATYADKTVVENSKNKYGNPVIKTTTYADGKADVQEYYYDKFKNMVFVMFDTSDGRKYNVEYTRSNGKVTAEQRSGKYALTKKYSYGNDGVLGGVEYKFACDLASDQYIQIEDNNLEENIHKLSYSYETDGTPDKRNSTVTLPFNVEQKFAYDGLGRTREVTLGENLVKDIYYQKFGDHATNRVSTVWYGVNGIRKDSLKYTYDKAGNITSICENGVVIARYVYDGLNRLICENNSQFNQKIKYEYDHAGNIVCKSVNGQKYKYSYPISGWRDQLLSYNGEECEYDAIGNPIKYRNRNLVWQGRRLKSISSGTSLATYTYDANNVRTSKTVTDEAENFTCKFIYDGNTLIAEQRNGTWIYYLYGVDGIAGFRYNGVTYLYRKNIQGDITHIYTEDGQRVAHYAYDAFGNTEILSETDKIGALNPFRYRGYYFDIETKLYYLISRYYDPETCRFISADGIEYLDPETLGGLNLYAYCGNNPVMSIDPDGLSWKSFWKGVGNWFKEHWVELVVGAVFIVAGVLSMGAAAAIGGATLGGVLATMGSAALYSLANVGISMAVSAGIGALIGGITGGWEGALQGFTDGLANGFMLGGIFAGTAQMLSGAMNITRSLASNFNGKLLGKVKIWSPNNAGNTNIGGTLIKFGKINRLDVEVGRMLHIHLKIFGHTFNHIALGTFLAGLLGGLVN